MKGLFYGDGSQLVAQLIGTATCFVFVFVMFYVFFKVLDKIIGNRVSAETEIVGLDLPEMGALAYPEFPLTTSTSSAYAGPSGEGTDAKRPLIRRRAAATARRPVVPTDTKE